MASQYFTMFTLPNSSNLHDEYFYSAMGRNNRCVGAAVSLRLRINSVDACQYDINMHSAVCDTVGVVLCDLLDVPVHLAQDRQARSGTATYSCHSLRH